MIHNRFPNKHVFMPRGFRPCKPGAPSVHIFPSGRWLLPTPQAPSARPWEGQLSAASGLLLETPRHSETGRLCLCVVRSTRGGDQAWYSPRTRTAPGSYCRAEQAEGRGCRNSQNHAAREAPTLPDVRMYRRDSPVIRWLRSCLPVQGSREDPTRRRESKPERHSYQAGALEPGRHSDGNPPAYSRCSAAREATARRVAPARCGWRKSQGSIGDPAQTKTNLFKIITKK